MEELGFKASVPYSHTWDEKVILMKKMYNAWLFDFLGGLGGGNDPLNFQNRAIGGF